MRMIDSLLILYFYHSSNELDLKMLPDEMLIIIEILFHITLKSNEIILSALNLIWFSMYSRGQLGIS